MTAQLTPYLVVHDARAAIAWYTEVLGARQLGDPLLAEDDRVGHAELDIDGALLYLADDHPELGLVHPDEGRVSVTLHLSVADVDAAVARAAEAGATVERPPTDAPYGRTGVVLDPYGHRWMLQTPSERSSAPAGPRPGDAVYLALHVPDGARARDFYEAVLGWALTPGRSPDGWETQMQTPRIGVFGGEHDEAALVPMYAVDDIEVAAAAVHTAGGTAGEIEQRSHGRSVRCRDDQGLPFWLGELPSSS